MPILLLIIQLFDSSTRLTLAVIASQTPAQQAEFWQRYLDSTKWMSDLLAQFSGDMSKLIAHGIANDQALQKTVPPAK